MDLPDILLRWWLLPSLITLYVLIIDSRIHGEPPNVWTGREWVKTVAISIAWPMVALFYVASIIPWSFLVKERSLTVDEPQ